MHKATTAPGLGASSVHKRLSFGAAVGNTFEEVSSGVRVGFFSWDAFVLFYAEFFGGSNRGGSGEAL